jgi:hypothetical protein
MRTLGVSDSKELSLRVLAKKDEEKEDSDKNHLGVGFWRALATFGKTD